jgi:hypothetical protein
MDSSVHPGGYRIEVSASGVSITAADDAGRRHAVTTLEQMRTPGHHPGSLPACEIEDWPDFPVRGVMLDISRDKVPTLETLRELAGRLASWKMNQLQLYTEHTFAYRGHEQVWKDASPFTPDELHDLDSYCAELGIELVPNQNALGHFDRWLKHDRYRPLAISPEGFYMLGVVHREAMTLDPAKLGSFTLVSDLLTQLAPHFTSRLFNIGLDEPFELPPQRAGEWVKWLARLRDLPALADHELLVWGDMLSSHPELIEELPPRVTICEWGYEENHPFDATCRRLEQAGTPFYVCPGTSSWLSITGRLENMLGNVAAAAAAGLAHGAGGYLVTDWGDLGHHQYLPVAEAGLAAAAAISWCAESNSQMDLDGLARLLDSRVFTDPASELGAAMVGLGRVHRMITPQLPNLSALFIHLAFPQWPVGAGITTGLSTDQLAAVEAQVGESLEHLERSRPQRPDGDLVVAEIRNAARLLLLACHDAGARLQGDGTLPSIGSEVRKKLSHDLEAIAAEHRRLWLARNRPGGLADSLAWLEHLKSCYESGAVDPNWFGPH